MNKKRKAELETLASEYGLGFRAIKKHYFELPWDGRSIDNLRFYLDRGFFMSETMKGLELFDREIVG